MPTLTVSEYLKLATSHIDSVDILLGESWVRRYYNKLKNNECPVYFICPVFDAWSWNERNGFIMNLMWHIENEYPYFKNSDS